MDMQQPTPNSQPQPAMGEAAPGQDGSVTIAKGPDGSFMVNGMPAKTIEEALAKVRELLTGEDGGMSVEQAFRGGFNANGGSGVPGDSMGGGY